MNIDNVIKFARGINTESPTLKKCVKEILWPLVIIALEIYACNRLWGYYRFLGLFLIIVVVVYLIITLKMLSYITLESYLSLSSVVCAMWFFGVLIMEFLLCEIKKAPFSSLLPSCIPVLVSPIVTAFYNYCFLKRKVKYFVKPLGRFGKALITVSAGLSIYFTKNYGAIMTAHSKGVFVGFFIINFLFSVGITVCIQRLYFARKYKINFEKSGDH